MNPVALEYVSIMAMMFLWILLLGHPANIFVFVWIKDMI